MRDYDIFIRRFEQTGFRFKTGQRDGVKQVVGQRGDIVLELNGPDEALHSVKLMWDVPELDVTVRQEVENILELLWVIIDPEGSTRCIWGLFEFVSTQPMAVMGDHIFASFIIEGETLNRFNFAFTSWQYMPAFDPFYTFQGGPIKCKRRE